MATMHGTRAWMNRRLILPAADADARGARATSPSRLSRRLGGECDDAELGKIDDELPADSNSGSAGAFCALWPGMGPSPLSQSTRAVRDRVRPRRRRRHYVADRRREARRQA